MSTYTAGPWTAIVEKDGDYVDGVYVVDAAEDVVISPRAKLSEADARLIAAAPDMLAILQECIDIIRDADGGNPETNTGWASEDMLDLWMRARAAIAKAE